MYLLDSNVHCIRNRAMQCFNEARNTVYGNLKYIGATCTQGMKQPQTNKINYQRFLLC